jgi:hypothetical protein
LIVPDQVLIREATIVPEDLTAFSRARLIHVMLDLEDVQDIRMEDIRY